MSKDKRSIGRNANSSRKAAFIYSQLLTSGHESGTTCNYGFSVQKWNKKLKGWCKSGTICSLLYAFDNGKSLVFKIGLNLRINIPIMKLFFLLLFCVFFCFTYSRVPIGKLLGRTMSRLSRLSKGEVISMGSGMVLSGLIDFVADVVDTESGYINLA